MYGQGFGLFAVWGYVISHEHGGIVELNPKLLSDLFGEPLESVSTVVNRLCSPDDDSRSKAQEGRRLVKIGQFAYQVVNAAEYAKIASDSNTETNTKKKNIYKKKVPSLEEFIKYITDNNLNISNPKGLYAGYADGGWIDTQGKPVKNWKLKLHTLSNLQQEPREETVEEAFKRLRNKGETKND